MTTIIPYLKPQDGIPVICDTIKEFYEYAERFEEREVPKMGDNPFMRVFIKEIDAEVVYFKEYENETSGLWACTKGCVDNGAVPIEWEPLENYRN